MWTVLVSDVCTCECNWQSCTCLSSRLQLLQQQLSQLCPHVLSAPVGTRQPLRGHCEHTHSLMCRCACLSSLRVIFADQTYSDSSTAVSRSLLSTLCFTTVLIFSWGPVKRSSGRISQWTRWRLTPTTCLPLKTLLARTGIPEGGEREGRLHYTETTVATGRCHSSGAVWESGWPSWAVRPNDWAFRFSWDIKQYWTMLITHWSQLVPNMATDIRGH